MAIRIYNTLTRTKEEFLPREPERASMYVCGVTSYAPAHIGHGRSAVAFDIIRRWLTHRGYEVDYVYNITDVEDKILAASSREQRGWKELAEGYTEDLLRDLAALNVLPPRVMPRASEHIPEIISLVETLIAKGHAYPLDGDVAFHVPSFPRYGKLSRRDLDAQMVGARVEEDTRKRDPRDFFLWKSAKPGEPSWDSPWGPGRPGWHIECSAMSAKYLGFGFDIHGGGSDLIFPHHENEIAQSEAACGGAFARYWMHNGMLNLVSEGASDAEKMSKSIGNVIPLTEAIARVGGPALRYYYATAHYGSDLAFSDTGMEQAASALERLQIARQTLERLLSAPMKEGGDHLAELTEVRNEAAADFEEAMDDDFNTPRALAALHGLVGAVNRVAASANIAFAPSEAGHGTLAAANRTLTDLAELLGLRLHPEAGATHGLANDLMQLLIEVRQQARAAGQWAIADAIRERLGALGIALEDRAEGTSWRRK
jgi:cysteinyl-tRNA synthetase